MINSIIWNNFFRHTQPDVMEQNDSEKFTDLMEITSSQVFVYLSSWKFDDIRVKKIIFYAYYSWIKQMLLK